MHLDDKIKRQVQNKMKTLRPSAATSSNYLQ